MKEKQKILLVKGIISISGILGLIVGYQLIRLQSTPETNQYFRSYEKEAIIFLILFFIFGLIMVVLLTKIDIRPKKSKPERIRFKQIDYEMFLNYFFEEVKNDNYELFKPYKKDGHEINYAIKHKGRQSYIIEIIKLKELAEDFDANEYMMKFWDYLVESEKVNRKDHINIIHVVCVNKVTKIFTNYTEQNIKQRYGRFNIQIGVSFGSNTIYIGTQVKGGLYISKYKELTEDFKKYIKNLLADE